MKYFYTKLNKKSNNDINFYKYFPFVNEKGNLIKMYLKKYQKFAMFASENLGYYGVNKISCNFFFTK